MKIIKQISDNAVIFTGDDLTLDAAGTHGNGWGAPSFTTTNAMLETIEGSLPPYYQGACFTFIDGVWAVLPSAQGQVDAAIAEKLAELKIQQTSLIQAQLAAADLKIIRSLAEGDTVRIEAHKASQAALRVQLK